MKTVRHLMRQPVITIGSGDTLRHAYRLMNEHHVRQLPVLEADRLVGILTDRDIRLHVIYMEDRFESADSFNEALETSVDEVMTRDVKVLHPHQSIDDALNLFISEKFGGAPVVEGDGAVTGILTYIDLLMEFRRLLA